MGVRIEISEKGIVQRKSTGGTGNSGLPPGALGVSDVTTDGATLVTGGVYAVSGAAALIVNLPDPAVCAGCWLTVRDASGHAHILSGTLVTALSGSTTGANVGAVITLDATLGSSIALLSDGAGYLVTAQSGTAGISG